MNLQIEDIATAGSDVPRVVAVGSSGRLFRGREAPQLSRSKVTDASADACAAAQMRAR